VKVKIFVDFWNLQLSWNEYQKSLGSPAVVKIPWERTLPQALLKRVGEGVDYAGTHVYASINPHNNNDRKLRSFLENMNLFPGYTVTTKERKPAKPVRCTHESCRKEITVCPYCSRELVRTVEKGVDTTIAIELFHFALEGAYDKAILVSNDEDFVPAIQYIQLRGKYIIHAGFRNQAFVVKRACWDHIDFEDIMPELLAPLS
jgi:uncharacterized LabA/DUF88 family protein